MIRRPPRSTLFPSRRSSDLLVLHEGRGLKQRRSGLFWSLPVLHPPARATEEACSSLPRVRIGDLPNPIQGSTSRVFGPLVGASPSRVVRDPKARPISSGLPLPCLWGERHDGAHP